jgi:hypothetical protein
MPIFTIWRDLVPAIQIQTGAPAPRLPLAGAEQDHQLRGANFFERECRLQVPCQATHSHQKNGALRALLSSFPLISFKTSQYFGFLPV